MLLRIMAEKRDEAIDKSSDENNAASSPIVQATQTTKTAQKKVS